MEMTEREVGTVGGAVLKFPAVSLYKMNAMEGDGCEVDKFRLEYDLCLEYGNKTADSINIIQGVS
jgi:hypothetical protein